MKIRAVMLAMFVFLLALCFSMLLQVYSTRYLSHAIHKNNSTKNMDVDDINDIAKSLTELLTGKLDSFEIVGRPDLTKKLSQKEILHMNDVKNIFKMIHYMSFICIMALLYLMIIYRKKFDFSIYLKSLCALFLAILLIIAFASIDFNSVFIMMHRILFNNDYWILNPSRDFIINFMPISLFIYMGIVVLLTFIVFVIMFSIILYIWNRCILLK